MTRPVLVDQHGRPLRASARTAFMTGRGFDGAGADRQQTRAWSTAPLPSVNETASRDRIAARARDLMRNSGVAAGAMRKTRAQTIGMGLSLRSKPEASTLGVEPTEALRFGRQIETVWRSWADDPGRQCDVKRRRTFGQLLRVLWSERFTTGENIAVLRWRPDRGTKFATCVQDMDTDRLSNPNEKPDTDELTQGVEFNEDGEAMAYHFRDSHRNDFRWSSKRWSWTRVPRIGDDGRRIVIHAFDEERAEQVRGVSPFAPILLAFRDLQRFTEAEIGAAVINATFAAFIKSGFDPAAVVEALGLDNPDVAAIGTSWHDSRMGIYGPGGLSVKDNKIPALAPGDEVEINNTTRQVGAFGAFKKAYLQDFATALGIPYMVLSEDWESVSYSAARAALAETWRIVTEDRASFIADTVSPIFAEVITEAFYRGYLVEPDGWPDFEDEPGAYLNANWTGPGRGYVDPLKEAQANELLRQMGVTTLDQICADQGRDWEDTLEQLAVEREKLREMGLTELDLASVLGAPQSSEEGTADQ